MYDNLGGALPPSDPFTYILQDLTEWLQVLRQMANEREAIVQRMVRQANLSQELSDLVVYCQPVPFDIESKLLSLLEA